MIKFCPSCKQNKPINEFAINRSKKDGLQISCKECQRLRDKVYYQNTKQQHETANRRLRLRNQQAVYEYLKTHPCVDCLISDPRILTFDHVRGEKLGNVSDMIKRPCSLETIFEEIAKCEVRCFNCHMIKDCLRYKPSAIVTELRSLPELPLNLPAEGQHISL
jgi:hypothetical protein